MLAARNARHAARVHQLEKRLSELSEMIQSGVADQMELARLKRRKLRLKDQIQLLLDDSIPDIIA